MNQKASQQAHTNKCAFFDTPNSFQVVNLSGGKDSTAMLPDRGYRLDAVMFEDWTVQALEERFAKEDV